MTKPWNVRKDDSRTANTLTTFIIFCEDKVSEPIYFKYFETNKIKINPIKNQRGMMDNVLRAICHCHEGNLFETTEDGLKLKDTNTQVWCVYDRDIDKKVTKNDQNLIKDTTFNESIISALNKGIKVAWSNDSFELWVLMHFEEINPSDDDLKKRDTYYERLTRIFQTLKNPNNELKKALKHNSFNYKKDLKHENNFREIVRPEMLKNTKTAIKRGEELEKHFESVPKHNYHKKSPCTMIHKLVKELVKQGGKEL